jgi:hypothetical protein
MKTKNSEQNVQDTQKNPKDVENCVNSADTLEKQPKSRQQIADEALNNATSKR